MELAKSRVEPESVSGRRRVHRSRAVLMLARLEAELADDLCLVCDISPMGARVKSTQPMAVGDSIRLDFGDMLEIAGTVRWSDDGYCGVEFEQVVDLAPLFERADAGEPLRPPHRQVLRHDAPSHTRRAHPRLRRCAHLQLRHGPTTVAAELFDVSPVGGRINLADTSRFALGDRVSFAIEDRFDCDGVVRWIGRSAIGVAFDPPLRMWKLEKWLLDGVEKCGDCDAADCSAPAFARALAKRHATRATTRGLVGLVRESGL